SQEERDLARERGDALELKRRGLADDELALGVLPVEPGQRAADVARHRRAEHRAEELGRRRLPVRPRDTGEPHAQEPVAELDLGPDRDSALARRRDERILARNARRLDEYVGPLEQPDV